MEKESNPIIVILVVAALCAAISAGIYLVQGPQEHAHHGQGPAPAAGRSPGVPEGVETHESDRPASAIDRARQGDPAPGAGDSGATHESHDGHDH
ncbi:MAG: hypothetical protein COZ56_04610 [Armatimonadetes bacterium CG_4_8_14_3_um_filter_58_9]|nr:MAG: hypothetical protein COZ56_04610 [Armatimonadetes bacterium CG_4_8_14_3_um_filter_58_9]